jgi:methionine synthase II (cobalamin-independent)
MGGVDLTGLRTTVAGSWWPQAHLEEELRAYHGGHLSASEAERTLNEAASTAIAEQRELGLTEWTGGEYFTYEFIEHLQRVLTGIEIEIPGKPELFDYDDLAVARIVGDLDAPNGLGYAEGFLREKDLDGGVTKATVAGPVEVAINLIGQYQA